MASTPLFDPETFFHERPHPSLIPPSLIVALYALLSIATGVLFIFTDGGEVYGDVPLVLIGVVMIVFILGVAFIVWLFTTGVLYLVSMVFGGTGGFRRLLAYVGWGYLPVLIATLITLPVWLFLFVRGVSVDVLLTSPPLLVRVTEGIGILMFLWSGYIWVFAVKRARTLTLRQSLITTAVPVVVYLGYSLMIYLVPPAPVP